MWFSTCTSVKNDQESTNLSWLKIARAHTSAAPFLGHQPKKCLRFPTPPGWRSPLAHWLLPTFEHPHPRKTLILKKNCFIPRGAGPSPSPATLAGGLMAWPLWTPWFWLNNHHRATARGRPPGWFRLSRTLQSSSHWPTPQEVPLPSVKQHLCPEGGRPWKKRKRMGKGVGRACGEGQEHFADGGGLRSKTVGVSKTRNTLAHAHGNS